MAQHHPSIELLTDYCSGSLRLSHAMCIATHLEFCETCRKKVQKLENVGAYYFDDVHTIKQNALSSSQVDVTKSEAQLKNKVFSMLDEHDSQKVDTATRELEIQNTDIDSKPALPKSLAQFASGDIASLNWSRVAPSIQVATLLYDKDGAQIALSCVKPGGTLPTHTHTGGEITVVLEGSFSDETGLFSKGDFIYRDASHSHKPAVTEDAECICLMVLDSPIRFTGWFSRLLNPFLKWHHDRSVSENFNV